MGEELNSINSVRGNGNLRPVGRGEGYASLTKAAECLVVGKGSGKGVWLELELELGGMNSGAKWLIDKRIKWGLAAFGPLGIWTGERLLRH